MTCSQLILFFMIKASKVTFLNKLSQLFSQGISCGIRALLTATLVAILHISRSVWAISGDMGIATQPLTNGSADYPWLIEDRADFEAFSANPAYWATGVNTVSLNYNKCIFKITMKNATVQETGTVDFDLSLLGCDLINLKRIDLGQ